MTADLSPPPFGAFLEFTDNRALVQVHGDIDISTAPDFEAVLAVGRSRQRDVIVDVSHVSFMDGRGIAVLARAAAEMSPWGGRLVVRAPAASTRWLVNATGLEEVVHVELGGADDEAGMTLRRVAAIPADRAVVRSALQLVVDVTETIVPGADVATISLAPRGQLLDVIASDDGIAVLDQHQYAIGEGPCLEAAEERQQMHVAETSAEGRWPTFIPRARELGVSSILSTPLRSGDTAFGALNMYAFREDAFPSQSHDLATSLADRAAQVLNTAASDAAGDDVAARLRTALEGRQTIAMAQGVLVERGRVSPDASYTILRRRSQGTGRPIRDVAGDVVASAEVGQGPPGEGSHGSSD